MFREIRSKLTILVDLGGQGRRKNSDFGLHLLTAPLRTLQLLGRVENSSVIRVMNFLLPPRQFQDGAVIE